ncbi:MAG: hypothetical protein B7X37_05980 [Halothiobacillus sp. 14-55-98]|jgi:23S rRNA (adenine2030-N6)-methyltransferase|nr:MAG: hypothetical protein B7X37_05980 [Halothiobacillus sp. 14-55-98]
MMNIIVNRYACLNLCLVETMNYQHHFHAGNHADVLKHLVLLQLIELMQQKPTGFLLLETHAGAGLYDLQASEARRSDEASGGIARLLQATQAADTVPILIQTYLKQIEQFGVIPNLGHYPGSPLLAVCALRPQDRYIGVELVPKVARELSRNLAQRPMLEHCIPDRRVIARDGEGLAALKADLPPLERRALILIDPPYEQPQERDDITAALQAGLQRFETGVYALWYPIKQRPYLDRWLNRIAKSTPRPVLAIENSIFPNESGNRLTGSGLLIINPPWQFDTLMQPVLDFVNDALKQDTAAPRAIRWLNPAQ